MHAFFMYVLYAYTPRNDVQMLFNNNNKKLDSCCYSNKKVFRSQINVLFF